MSGHESGATVVQDLAVSASRGGDYRPRGGSRFQRHHPERLAFRSVDADGRPRVDAAECVLVDAAAEHHSSVEAETARQPAQVLLLGPFAYYAQTAVRQPGQRLDHQGDALVLPEVADEQQRV